MLTIVYPHSLPATSATLFEAGSQTFNPPASASRMLELRMSAALPGIRYDSILSPSHTVHHLGEQHPTHIKTREFCLTSFATIKENKLLLHTQATPRCPLVDVGGGSKPQAPSRVSSQGREERRPGSCGHFCRLRSLCPLQNFPKSHVGPESLKVHHLCGPSEPGEEWSIFQ